MKTPKTLQQAIIHFSDTDNCLEFMAMQRWPDGLITCPTCGRKDVSFLANQKKWQCKSAHAKRQFSAKVELFSRTLRWALRSGSPAFGSSPTPRTALAPARLHGRSVSPRRLHGSCCTASGMR